MSADERKAAVEAALFLYAPDVLARFPGIRGGVLHARGLRTGPTPRALAEALRAEQAAAVRRIGDLPLSEVASLAAWRRAFSSFGVKPTQYRCAAEALLRRLTKKGDLPEVNLLTDIGNLVSIRYALPVAVLDTRRVVGAISVCFARGDESFTELDAEGTQRPEPGEVIFVDEMGTVHARRWCWRQSAQSAAREDTIAALVTVEGHHPDADREVRAALADLSALLQEHAGASVVAEVLSPQVPVFRPR